MNRIPLTVLSPAGSRARLLVVTYHRVLERRDPFLPGEPDAKTFALQMRWLAASCNVLSLSEAVTRLESRTLPARAACITFDDGYANNHDVAMPILLELGLPATVYVTVDAIERGVMWNDLAIEAVRTSAGSQEPSVQVESVLSELKYRPLQERWDAAAQLYERATESPLPRLMMTRDMVSSMARRGFDIGAHTVNHSILKTLSAEAARSEIVGSRDWITQLLGKPPTSFAYPNGRPGRDYDDSHAQIVKEAGFASAVSTRFGCAIGGADRFQLPRAALWDETPIRFWARLGQIYLSSYRSR